MADIPTIFQDKNDQTLENKHPAWLDDFIIVIKGSKEQHEKELLEVLTRLEYACYRLSENKSEFFKLEIKWIGNKKDQKGIRVLQDKLMAIKNLKQATNYPNVITTDASTKDLGTTLWQEQPDGK